MMGSLLCCWTALRVVQLSSAYSHHLVFTMSSTSTRQQGRRTRTIHSNNRPRFAVGGIIDVQKRKHKHAAPLFSQNSQQEGDNELEAQRSQLMAALGSVQGLRDSLERASLEDNNADDSREEKIELTLPDILIDAKISELEKDIELSPPIGLSRVDYSRAIRLFMRLPFSLRYGFCLALDMSEEEGRMAAVNFNRVPQIVSRLYDERYQLTPQRLEDSFAAARKFALPNPSQQQSFSGVKDSNLDSNSSKSSSQNKNSILSSIFSDDVENQLAQELFGRVTRQDSVATEQDLKLLLKVLKSNQELFIPRGNEEISGGFVVRGVNKKQNGAELVGSLNKMLPPDWSAQVCYLPDFFTVVDENSDGGNDPALVLLNKDMSPSANKWLLLSSTILAAGTTFLFAIGVYGSTDAVVDRLTELTTKDGDISGGLMWFNAKVFEVIFPLVVVQGLHELGHLTIAWRDKLKLTLPTLLPFWGLPFMGAQTHLKESPKSLSSLFDFAILGPLLGIGASLAFLVYGLQLTVTIDSDMVQYLPVLPARILQASTLGGTIVDNILGGNILAMTSVQAGSAQIPAIPLHPFAVAGFVSLIIQCLDLLPLGATDGGRLSLALFGRQGHSLIGGLTWFALLISSLLGDYSDILMGAWVVNNFAQNDPEIPCQNEVDQINLPRSLAAMSLWFFAGLVLIPVQVAPT